MMHAREDLRAATFPGGKIVELPYRDTNLVMDVIVPDDAAGLPALESKLTGATFAGLTASLSRYDVSLALPKFSFKWGGAMKEPLDAMGMRQAFTGGADFSGISSKENLMIDSVIHKTFVAVDEAGTEAAAATAIVMRDAAVMPASPHLDVQADRPFVIVVREGSQVLFLGHVTNPKAA
jgi:serpin B